MIEQYYEQTKVEQDLERLMDRRTKLCNDKLDNPTGQAANVVNAKLSEVNREIKRLNRTINHRTESHSLYSAIKKLCANDLQQQIFDTALGIRLGSGK
jgi:DNA repair exonuclease SbcCD ATPase subunit